MQDIVFATISKLVAQKKQPSVALVKAHLTHAVPMPVIIDVLARFKKNPDDFISEQQVSETTTEQHGCDASREKLPNTAERLLGLP